MSVRLLIEANLSWRLVSLLKKDFPEIIHVVQTGLSEYSSDSVIWEYVLANSCNIITNDEDFYLLAVNKGFPPKTVLLKLAIKARNT